MTISARRAALATRPTPAATARPTTRGRRGGAVDRAGGCETRAAASVCDPRPPGPRAGRLLGSRFYVQQPLVPLEQTVAYVNLDIEGSNLLPSLRRMTFTIGAETGGERLTSMVADAIGPGPLDARQVSAIFGQGRSDYVNFTRAAIPRVFFSDATGPCYHTAQDDIDVVDFWKLGSSSPVVVATTTPARTSIRRSKRAMTSTRLAPTRPSSGLWGTFWQSRAPRGMAADHRGGERARGDAPGTAVPTGRPDRRRGRQDHVTGGLRAPDPGGRGPGRYRRARTRRRHPDLRRGRRFLAAIGPSC